MARRKKGSRQGCGGGDGFTASRGGVGGAEGGRGRDGDGDGASVVGREGCCGGVSRGCHCCRLRRRGRWWRRWSKCGCRVTRSESVP